jgi:prepilin-type N-terminal cleavage/methylation domain-containing protein
MNRRSATHAFTLIELLVVIIIIAVLASVVLPSYARFWSRTRFDGAARSVRDLLAYARERAIVNDTVTSVTFDTRNQAFQAEVMPPPANQDQPVALGMAANADPATGQVQEAPRSYKLDAEFAVTEFTLMGNTGGTLGNRPTNELRFRGDGTCDGAQITLASESGYSLVLTVWPGTGRITVEDQ